MANVLTRNTVSGQLGYVPEDYLDHPVLGQTLERVKDGTKPFHPELHAETDIEGKDSSGKQVRTPKKPAEDDLTVPEAVN